MKFCFILISVSLLHAAASVYSQTATITVENNHATISDVFTVIEQQTEYKIFYKNDQLDVNRPADVKAEKMMVKDALSQIFRNSDCSYTMFDRLIVVTPRSDMVHQGIIITGTVTDNSEPMPGVNVLVKGTVTGVVTDINGKYSIAVPDKDAILVFSFVGYTNQEIVAGEHKTINVILIEDTQEIEEVIVVGYGTMKKSDVTGSIVSIKARDLKDISATNTARALQGKAAGVDIVAAGQKPGDGSTIRVRGTRSFSASNDPLYIIDGIPFNRWINDLNPADIESIEILKDASATAIYGSRGANGVILITTKKAKAGKAEVSYDFYYGFQSAQKTYDMMNGPQYLEMLREAGRAANLYPQDGSVNLADDLKLMKYRDQWTDESVTMGYDEAGVYRADRVRSFDWGNAALQTGNIMSHQISFTGGNDKAMVMISAGYYKNEGIIKGQDFERFSFRVNAEYAIKKWLKIGGSTAFTPNIKNDGSNIYWNATSVNPLAIPFDKDGYIIDQPTKDPYVWNINYDFDRKNFISEQRRYRFMGSFYLDLNIGHGFKYRMNFGPDFGFLRTGDFAGVNSWSKKGGLSTASEKTEQ